MPPALLISFGAIVSFLCLCMMVIAISPADAHDGAADCSPTPTIGTAHFYPGEMDVPKSNNLRRKTEEADFATGEPLYVEGQLLDHHCVPIAGAIIDLWHPNTFGRYHVPSDRKAGSLDPFFAGAGRTATDNNGRFRFLTVYPGRHNNTSPHFHIRIKHSLFQNLDTQLYFDNDAIHESENVIKRLKPWQQSAIRGRITPHTPTAPNEGMDVFYTLVLKGHDKRRTY